MFTAKCSPIELRDNMVKSFTPFDIKEAWLRDNLLRKGYLPFEEKVILPNNEYFSNYPLYTHPTNKNRVVAIGLEKHHYLVYARINVHFYEIVRSRIFWNKTPNLRPVVVKSKIKQPPSSCNRHELSRSHERLAYYLINNYTENMIKDHKNFFIGLEYYFMIHDVNQAIPSNVFELPWTKLA